MAAVDVLHRNNKPLPSPRLGGTRKLNSRPRKHYVEAAEDDEDELASVAASEEAEAADAFTLVPHVAEQTLHAVHAAIFGQPWADLELVVSTGGKNQEVIYANSKVLKKACPALMRQISQTGRAELDTMEQEQIAAAAAVTAAQNKNTAAARRSTVRPQASRRSTNSLGLVDYGRNSRLGALNDSEESAGEIEREEDAHDEDEYADSVAEQPKHQDEDEHDEEPHQDVDDESPVGSRSKVAGATPIARQALPEVIVPPTFSRSSSRFSKLMKFMNKDKTSPTAELVPELPFAPVGAATHTDYANENKGRMRRYNAGNAAASPPAAPRGSNASRVPVTGCSAATLQALIFYLYTGHATFATRLPAAPSRRFRRTRRDSSSSASLNSDRADSIQESVDEHADETAPVARISKSSSFPPVFSATAAYCVGRQLGLRDLATKAFDHICLELSPKTVLADLLSPFVDRFDEVQRAHLAYIAENWDRVKRRPDFEQTVGRLVMGEYRESRKALLKLFAKLSVA